VRAKEAKVKMRQGWTEGEAMKENVFDLITRVKNESVEWKSSHRAAYFPLHSPTDQAQQATCGVAQSSDVGAAISTHHGGFMVQRRLHILSNTNS
jgi:hypothetical protein